MFTNTNTNTNTNININEDELTITNDWIEKFDKEDKEYSSFYKEQIETLSVNFIYISNNRQIETISNSTIYLSDGILSKESLIEIIKKNKTKNKIKYKPVSILKYHINLEPDDVNDYLLNIKNDNEVSKLEVINKIDDIYFEESISIMNDLVCIYILFLENNSEQKYHQKHQNNQNNQSQQLHTQSSHQSSQQSTDDNKNIKKVTFNLTKKIINPEIKNHHNHHNKNNNNNNYINYNKTKRIYK
jgi:hypothetical protein